MKFPIKYTILSAFAVVLFLNGCKKDNTSTTTTPTSSKLRTYTEPNGTVDSFYYDASNRLARLKTTDTTGYLSYVYKSSDSVLVYASNGTDSALIISYKLNGAGQAISATSPAFTSTYSYDANGYLTYITTNTVSGSTRDTFVISGNNVTEHRSGNSVLFTNTNVRQAYTFLSGKTNTIGNTNRGIGFFGKESSELINQETFKRTVDVSVPPSNTTSSETYTYTYEYDSAGRVTKVTKTAASTSIATVETYTYY